VSGREKVGGGKNQGRKERMPKKRQKRTIESVPGVTPRFSVPLRRQHNQLRITLRRLPKSGLFDVFDVRGIAPKTVAGYEEMDG
jgi:hypothetical protein